MKVSLIIAVYKDIEALNLILQSLVDQTYKNFEVVISEDGRSKEIQEYIKTAKKDYCFEIIHTIQDDTGVRKSRSQNNGIKASTGEYLIFIDGDCILYSDFLHNHILLSSPKTIVSGRRVNLGPRYSQELRSGIIESKYLEKKFMMKYFDISSDAKSEKHTEEGFRIKINGLIDIFMNQKRKKRFPLLGCNMSFYKQAMLDINGFDEGLGNSAMAGDTDLEWRFESLGYKIRPGRFIVNLFHLYHTRSTSDYARGIDEKMITNKNNNRFICKEGIHQL